MANSYYSIGTTTPIADILASLQNKYGSGNVTVHYQAAEYLIFSITAISDKVVKISCTSGRLIFYYGDAWTSTTTITNSVTFAGYNTGTFSEAHLVLGDNLFYMCILASTISSTIAVIGKLTNNDYIALGLLGTSSYKANSLGRNTTDGTDFTPVVLSKGFANSAGKLYKQNVVFRLSSGAAEENTDGSLASLSGLYNISHSMSASTLLKGTNYLMSPTSLYMAVDALIYIPTCLYAEY